MTPTPKKNLFNIIGSTQDLEKAIIAYLISFTVTFLIFIFFIKKSIIKSLIFSLILSQVFLIFIFIPTRYNIFTEFNNTNALYIFIQTVTPIVVYIFAIVVCLRDCVK